MINIYCDESCHLENDNQQSMVIGGISCPDYARQTVYNVIKNIKIKHKISPFITPTIQKYKENLTSRFT